MLLQCLAHDLPAASVGAVQPPDQRVVMAEREKQCRRPLVVVGRMPHHQSPQGARLLHHVARRHQKPEPQAGEQCLRQRADVDDASIVIERLERRAGLVHVVGLEFVVVLDDDHIMLGRALEQFHAALQRHGHGGWKLVAGRGEDEVAGVELITGRKAPFIHRQQRHLRQRLMRQWRRGHNMSGAQVAGSARCRSVTRND